jgi:hypothetical protein
MRNTPLGQVRLMVKAQCGKSLDATATSQDAEINQLISDCQAQLAASYDWPFLKQRWDSILAVATRFQTFPTTFSPQGGSVAATGAINFERPPRVETKWNNIWQEVIYGIDDIPEFNYLDSDRAQVLDPAQRWQFSDETNYEIWPLPASAAQIRFIGQRQLIALGSYANGAITWDDTALCDLDDLLLTYHVAAEYMLREENSQASIMAEKAQRRLIAVLGAYPVRSETITIGRGTPLDRKAIRQVPLVLVGGK